MHNNLHVNIDKVSHNQQELAPSYAPLIIFLYFFFYTEVIRKIAHHKRKLNSASIPCWLYVKKTLHHQHINHNEPNNRNNANEFVAPKKNLNNVLFIMFVFCTQQTHTVIFSRCVYRYNFC